MGDLLYSTYFGNSGRDFGIGIALDGAGGAVIAGSTEDPAFPTTPGCFDPTWNGPLRDGFVARFDLLPTGVSRYGTSTPGCAGGLYASVTSMPQVGNVTFAVTCTNAPPNALGLIGISGPPLATSFDFQGAQIWIDVWHPAFFFAFVPSNGVGYSVVPAPIPALPVLAGIQASVQFAWANTCAPGGVSASDALAITIQ
jgi:hypothetical protein